MNSIDEIEIVDSIRQRKNEGLVALMNHYGKLVYYVASKVLNKNYDDEDVKDCYNEVFTAIWFNIECFKEEKGSFKGWIIAITKYKALNIKRKIIKTGEVVEYNDELKNEENKDFDKIENLDYINHILSNLKEEDKTILIKRYLNNYSIEEISNELNRSKENIYTRISRAKKKLKEIINYSSE